MAGAFELVRVADHVEYLGSNIQEILYDNGTTAGNSAMAVFATTSSAADFDMPPDTIADTAGNIYNLIQVDTNNENTNAGVFMNFAAYVCYKTIEHPSEIGLETPPAFISPGMIQQYAMGFQFRTLLADFASDDSFYEEDGADGFILTINNTGTDDLTVACIWSCDQTETTSSITIDNDESVLVDMTYSGISSNASMGTAHLCAWDTDTAPLTTTAEVTGASGTFGFTFGLSARNSGGGSAAETLTFNLNKGPDPTVPTEGRAIATVQIDLTQQQSHIFTSVDYPEFANPGDNEGVANNTTFFVVIEFDLEHLFQGSGLSKVHTLMAWTRLNFNESSTTPIIRQDGVSDEDAPETYAIMLTNMTTLQTVMLGGSNSAAQGNAEFLCVPFPANKGALKYRLISPQNQNNNLNPVGKVTLQFLNFEQPPIVLSGTIAPFGD